MSAQEERQLIIREELPKLIEALTGFDREEENFKRCEQFAWYTIKNHKNLSVNSHEIKRKMDGMMEKFIVGNYKHYADYLKKLYTELVNHPLCLNHYEVDVHWAILEFLLSLSYNPVGSLRKNKLKISLEPLDSDSQSSESDAGYWIKLLKKDCIALDAEKYDADSDLSDWSDSDSISTVHDEILNSERALEKPMGKLLVNIRPPEKETSFKLFNGSSSQQILLENTQNSWWADGHNICKVNSSHDSANFCAYWNKYISEKSNNLIKFKQISTASEYCLLREIIWMFHFPVEGKFFCVDNDNIYVRENVSIPSVMVDGLRHHLEGIIPYIKMLNSIRQFIYSVYYYDEKPPPKIYEYYVPSLQSILQPFYEELLHQEEIIKKQAPYQIKTIIQFEYNMRKSFKYLERIYDIHTSIVLDFKTVHAHICSAHLLAGLMLKYNMGDCLMTCNLAISLFLSTVKVFCNIIDNWWTEGRLDDWRNEFVVEKSSAESEDVCARSYVKSRERAFFVASDVSTVIHNDAFLKLLIEHSLEAGCTLNLLYQINKIGDLKNSSKFERTIYDIFVEEVFENIEQFRENSLGLPQENEQIDITADATRSKCGALENVNSFTSSISLSADNEFLMMVFDCNFKNEEKENIKIRENHASRTKALEIYDKLKNTSIIILPMEEIILKCISRILQTRISHANMFVMKMYREEFGVLRHLQNIRRVLLLESSDLMHYFYKKLFIEIESGKQWANPFLLTVQLDGIMCSKFPDVSSMFCVEIGSPYKCQTLKVVDAIDELTINYDVKKELRNIITQSSIDEYNKVFRFLLKVKWSMWTLESLPFPLSHKNRSPYASFEIADLLMRQLEQVRLWVMYTIQNIHFHLMTHVLQSMGERLDKKIQNCTNLAEMKSVHESYIKTVSEHCFTNKGNADIKRAIEQLFNLIHIFRLEWMSCIKEIDSLDSSTCDCLEDSLFDYVKTSQVDGIKKTYINCQTFLAKVLNHEAYVNQNTYLSGLSDVFNSCLPC